MNTHLVSQWVQNDAPYWGHPKKDGKGNMKERLRRFMEGRYGADELNRFLTLCGWVLLVAGFVLSAVNSKAVMTVGTVLVSLSWVLLFWSVFRTLSKNTARRAAENYAYFTYKNRVQGFFGRLKQRRRDRKTHRYYRCPQCRTTVRVPRGKGKIRITCPKCKHQFVKKS